MTARTGSAAYSSLGASMAAWTFALYAEATKALDKPELARKLADRGVDQMWLSSAEFDAMIKREIQSNGAVVKAAGLKPSCRAAS